MDPPVRIGASQDVYQCGIWTENFGFKEKIGTHFRSNQNYASCCRCEVCGKLFSRLSDLKTHLWVHTKEKPYACDLCNKTFSQIGSRNSHRRKAHRESNAGISSLLGSTHSPSTSNQPHTPNHLQMLVVSQGNSCTAQTESMSRVQNQPHTHMHASQSHSHIHPQLSHSQHQHHHSVSHSQPTQAQQLVQGQVASHSHDQQHSQCHNQNEQNRKHSPPCDVCGKTFAFTNYIKLHQTVHTKEKPFSCDLCPKKFSQPSSRNRHRKKSHKPESTGVSSTLALVPHQSQSTHQTSTSLQPKKNSPPCEICGKTFAFKNYMKAHSRVHTKEKPYACDLCFRRFTQASSRNFHRKRMHKEASLIEPSPQQMAMQPPVTSLQQSNDEKPFHCKECLPNYPAYKQ